jgi:DNA-binding transcriptional ArsR family regulator
VAADTFERLDARPWADRARAELAATGETRRRRDPSTIDELTPQELQIALFLSPKTVEYHLRHVYQKLGINSRDQLAQALAAQAPPQGPGVHTESSAGTVPLTSRSTSSPG